MTPPFRGINGLHQTRGGSDRTSAARAAIYTDSAYNLAISGNRVGDDLGTKTQQHAYHLTNVTSARFAGNNDVGNAVGIYNLGTGNTDLTESSMTVVV